MDLLVVKAFAYNKSKVKTMNARTNAEKEWLRKMTRGNACQKEGEKALDKPTLSKEPPKTAKKSWRVYLKQTMLTKRRLTRRR